MNQPPEHRREAHKRELMRAGRLLQDMLYNRASREQSPERIRITTAALRQAIHALESYGDTDSLDPREPLLVGPPRASEGAYWFIQHLGDRGVHRCEQTGVTIYADCGKVFSPKPANDGELALALPLRDFAQICRRCTQA
ncbi:hypothetical protein [Sciscionella marina]|uniref:hypothetical protein n=1 Tax=Sciscionella marina TaxID=508770 RepID=UPI0012F7016D|nr:hypothetical protein [Sciscionella marina]